MDLLVTHGGCLDGWCAGLALDRVMGAAAVAAGRDPPTWVEKPADAMVADYLALDPDTDRDLSVVFADCSPSREDLEYLAWACGGRCEALVIDHHATTRRRIEHGYYDDPPMPIRFVSGDRAACVLTWQYCYPGQPVPRLFLYVEDRDLWRWELEDSKDVSAYLASLPYDKERWWRAIEGLDEDAQLLMAAGAGAMVRCYQERLIERILEGHQVRRVEDGSLVGVVNTPVLISECAAALLQQEPRIQLAAVYRYVSGERMWSLRCRESDHEIDVSEIAESFGGGGHRCAAGFVERPGDPAFAA